jgi:hypothetical protein
MIKEDWINEGREWLHLTKNFDLPIYRSLCAWEEHLHADAELNHVTRILQLNTHRSVAGDSR